MRGFLSFSRPFPTIIQIIRPRGCHRSFFSAPSLVFSSSSNGKGLNPAEKEVWVRRSPVLRRGRAFDLRCIAFGHFRWVLDVSNVGQSAALLYPLRIPRPGGDGESLVSAPRRGRNGGFAVARGWRTREDRVWDFGGPREIREAGDATHHKGRDPDLADGPPAARPAGRASLCL